MISDSSVLRCAPNEEDILWRRIINNPDWVTRGLDGNFRVSSVAFIDRRTRETSVHLAEWLVKPRSIRD